ncbi:MAG: type II secretion system F family protein [Planctomycetota bacterium]|jgi:tight adherence protein B|nr:type II secretion system F family protein [Planctomycetota bacterium]
MMVLIIAGSVGICVAAIIGAVAVMVRGDEASVAEDRLSTLTAKSRKDIDGVDPDALTFRNPLEGTTNVLEQWMTRQFNMKVMLEQAGIKMPLSKFSLMCLGMSGVGAIGCLFAPIPWFIAPVAGIILFFLPFFWVSILKKRRISKFNQQLPEALEMLSRSLRAGHSLGAGFGLIAEEMPDPLAREFGRCFEEQNFGVSLEQSLESMTQRIPNLDLRFFATAVILQRQTGGDLAEILDKIGNLVRARYRLAGQIQALTGEGRLSGIVLLALPPGLFTAMMFLNREYIMKLFTDPMGQWLLGGAIVMQFLGALVIRKIIDIKV